ncbi:MAG: DUF4125 family protein [Bacteroidales bacterium]|nr:DUF4125 family protein [Clostridium sp.]MCM1203606.1 DUF4125 family protein [Bacteroidales bacterium]
MDVNQVLQGLDDLFAEGKLNQVEEYLQTNLEQAEKEGDFGAAVSILNEMLGFARETSQYDKCERYGSRVLKLLEDSPYKGSVSHATTLLNVANAMRAAGKLKESQAYYRQTEDIYYAKLPEGDYAFASLYNNEGLLCEELGDYEGAAESFRKAIQIVSAYPGNEYYQAVSYANLANAEVMLKEYAEAKTHAEKALELFAPLQVEDSHKGAALAALGEIEAAAGNTEKAVGCYRQAESCILHHIGKNAAYYRVHERLNNLLEQCGGRLTGKELCREYYETFGAPMLEKEFPEYLSRIAVGHVGEGSDCFGFDDALSEDHDFGPGFSLWITKGTAEEIGEQLQAAYLSLPAEFKGYRRVESAHGAERFGVCIIDDFYERVLSGGHLPQADRDYLLLEDCYLACAVNGEVYRDDEGIFTGIRNKLKQGYPEGVKLLKIAQKAALMGQNLQYNYRRCAERGEWTAALLAKADGIRQGMQLIYLLNDSYAPHDKWLHRGLKEMDAEAFQLVEKLTACDETEEQNNPLMEQFAGLILKHLREHFYVTTAEKFLPDAAVEVGRKGQLFLLTKEELVKALQRLKAERGETAAGEQYIVWNKLLLVQYCMDLENLPQERTMEENIPEQKRAIMETIISIQQQWREEFIQAHKEEKTEGKEDAFQEKLRNELSGFSDVMLALYGRFIVEISGKGINLEEQKAEAEGAVSGQ